MNCSILPLGRLAGRIERREYEARASTAAISGTQAADEFITWRVAQLARHQANGTGSRSNIAFPRPSARIPSVAIAVGSGAMPKTSAARNERPDKTAMAG